MRRHLDFLDGERRRERRAQAMAMGAAFLGMALFAAALFIDPRESQARVALVLASSMAGGAIITRGFAGRVDRGACLALLVGGAALFAISVFPGIVEAIDSRVEGSAFVVLIPPLLAFACARAFRKPRMIYYKPDSRLISIHEAGHAIVLPALGEVSVAARMDAAPEQGFGGRITHGFRGSPRAVHCAGMLVTLGGICAEEEFCGGSRHGYESDMVAWEMAAREWLLTFGIEPSPVMLHSLMRGQEMLLAAHMRANREVVERVAERFREAGEIGSEELASLLSAATADGPLKEWFGKNSDSGAAAPSFPDN